MHRVPLRQFGDTLQVVAACNKGLLHAAPLFFGRLLVEFRLQFACGLCKQDKLGERLRPFVDGQALPEVSTVDGRTVLLWGQNPLYSQAESCCQQIR